MSTDGPKKQPSGGSSNTSTDARQGRGKPRPLLQPKAQGPKNFYIRGTVKQGFKGVDAKVECEGQETDANNGEFQFGPIELIEGKSYQLTHTHDGNTASTQFPATQGKYRGKPQTHNDLPVVIVNCSIPLAPKNPFVEYKASLTGDILSPYSDNVHDQNHDYFELDIQPKGVNKSAEQIEKELLEFQGDSSGWTSVLSNRSGDITREVRLIRHNDVLLWEADKEETTSVSNPEHNWLTYETLFNLDRFRKTNQKCQMGQYRIALSNARIFIAEDMPEETLKELAAAFFPDCKDPQRLIAKSVTDCPWQERPKGVTSLQPSTDSQTTSRNQAVITVVPNDSVVMPYNFVDNDGDSRAIGTKKKSHFGNDLLKLKSTWPFWKTASRSCIVQLTPTTKDNADQAFIDQVRGNADKSDDSHTWTYKLGDTETNFETVHKGTDQFKFSSMAKGCYSVKTGITYVGVNKQAGENAGGKDVLETNSIDACLRSDFVTYIDKEVKYDASKDPHLLVQKELLTVTEVKQDDPTKPGDGFQVRELTCLDPSLVYFPPISIPFVDLKMTDRSERYGAIKDASWVDFWKVHYAAALGRAKALFLLRYALQMGSPNAQNFLIEMSSDLKPTGRIVMRDLGDAQLYREVAWAIYGKHDKQPADGNAGWDTLAEMDCPALKFECNELRDRKGYIMETGVVDPSNAYGKVPGLQMRWNMFSSLARGVQVARDQGSTDQDVRAPGWQSVLHANSVWGRAHTQAFVETFNDCLGIDSGVDALQYPNPERYSQLPNDAYEAAGKLYDEDLAWEEAQSLTIQKILASKDGQAKVREYHSRQWKPAGKPKPKPILPPADYAAERREDTPNRDQLSLSRIGEEHFLLVGEVQRIDTDANHAELGLGSGGTATVALDSISEHQSLKKGDLVRLICKKSA